MLRFVKTFRADEEGTTSIEYGLIVAVVGLGLVVALSALPGTLNSIWAGVATHLK